MKGTLGAPRAKARADIVLLSEAAAVPNGAPSGGGTPTQRRALHTDDEDAIGPGDVDLAKEEAPPWPAAVCRRLCPPSSVSLGWPSARFAARFFSADTSSFVNSSKTLVAMTAH